MKLELRRQEIAILIAWAEEATKSKYGLGDESVCLTWEEEHLLENLRSSLKGETSHRDKGKNK